MLPQSLDDSLSSQSSSDGAATPARPSVAQTRKLLKGKIQTGVQEWVNDFWKEKIGHYIMQGDYLALIMEEENCITWKSYLWDIPQGVLKFALKSSAKKPQNLVLWGLGSVPPV